MVLKVYFENKPVFLTDTLSEEITEFMHHPETIYMDEISTPAINSLLHEMNNPTFTRGILFGSDLKKTKKSFFKHFKIIKAAGGVVTNEKGEILFIYRRDKWDLPKGKNDENENAADCALREVKEETGLNNVQMGPHICTTYHVYNEYGKHILKETEWFKMSSSSSEILVPQLDEGIEKIEWVNEVNIPRKLENSYDLIVEVLAGSGITFTT